MPSNIHGHIRQRVDVGLQESHTQYLLKPVGHIRCDRGQAVTQKHACQSTDQTNQPALQKEYGGEVGPPPSHGHQHGHGAPAVGAGLADQGQLGGVEIQFLQGPLRARAAYVGRTRLDAITESPEAEAAWFDVLIADPTTGKDQARVTFCLRFMKAASPLWT